MKNQNYIVLVHFAAKLSRQNLAAIAPGVNAAIRSALSDCEPVLVGDTCVAFLGSAQSAAPAIFKEVASGLRLGDHLSVIELGDDLVTSHPAALAWHLRRQTRPGAAPHA